MTFAKCALLALCTPALWGADSPMAAQAVAIVTKSDRARVVRARDHANLVAGAGELLLSGDTLEIPNSGGLAEFSICTAQGSKAYRLTTGQAAIRADGVSGAVEIPGAPGLCLLPSIELDPAIGMMTERSLGSEKAPAALTPAELARMSAADRAALQSLGQPSRADLTARISRAVLLQRNGIDQKASAALLSIAEDWPDQQWARTLGYTIATRQPSATPGTGRLFAAFIGISEYEQKNIRGLKYADKDALLFASFMTMARAQFFSPDRLYLRLLNSDARSTQVRNKLKEFFDQAQAGDSVLLYIAAHGVGDNTTDDGFVVLYDTHLESTHDNSLSMEWIRELFVTEAARVRHVYLFIDTCHANRIGPIRNFGSADGAVGRAAQVVTDGKVFAMYASGPNQSSYENPRYGGGHGAFTYFVMRGLNITTADPDYRKADLNGDGTIDADELVSYVEESVKTDTHLKQSPKDDVRIDRFAVSTKLAGLNIAPCCGPAKPVAGANVIRDPTLPADGDTRSIEWTPSPAQEERAAWEEKSQQVLYKYLRGEEVAPLAADYAAGLDATRRAIALAGESLYLEARAEFFEGRLLLFSKTYDAAAAHLEKAIRMDPASPYPFNALGMAYLELGRYSDAEAAFLDAIRRADNWAYPRHNLALVYLQRGDYSRAIGAYRDAEQRTPQYSYLPYNLGLIYQRLNDTDEATREYKLALKNAPNRAAPLVALGALMSERGRDGKARDYYRQATEVLRSNPEREVLLNLRHNQGTLEARSRGGLERARTFWQANIDEADYLPSRFALARAFAAARNQPDALATALDQYSKIVAKIPENAAAWIEYSSVLYRARRTDEAIQILEKGLAAKPGDPVMASALARLRAGRPPQ